MIDFKLHYFWTGTIDLQGYPYHIKELFKSGVQVRLWAIVTGMEE